MCRFHNTLVTLTDTTPSYTLVFHLGHTPTTESGLLTCQEIRAGDTIDVYVPDVPTKTPHWTNTIKQQFKMILQVAQKHQVDSISIVVDGSAKQEIAAIAIHQTIRDIIGVMYMIEFCMLDNATRKTYESTIPPIYRA